MVRIFHSDCTPTMPPAYVRLANFVMHVGKKSVISRFGTFAVAPAAVKAVLHVDASS